MISVKIERFRLYLISESRCTYYTCSLLQGSPFGSLLRCEWTLTAASPAYPIVESKDAVDG